MTPALLLEVGPWPVKTVRESTVTAKGSRCRFGGYLNRGRSAKGGIGQERFPLDLAEYVGRDNHRNGTTETQNTDYETIGEATHLVTALGLYPQLILLTRHTTRPSMVQLKPPLHPETWIPFQLSRDVEIT